MLFVGHDAKRAPQHAREAFVGVLDGFESLGPAGELGLFEAVGGSRTNDGNDGHKAVNVAHIGHAGEAGHGGAFNVVNAASIARRDHVPDARIAPRLDVAFTRRILRATEQADFEGVKVEGLKGAERLRFAAEGQRGGGSRGGDVWIVCSNLCPLCLSAPLRQNRAASGSNRTLRVPQHGEAALGEDVELDEADGFDGIHVEVGGGPAFAADEGGCEAANGIAGEHDAAGVHLGVAREVVEHAGHEQRGAQRLFLPGAVVTLT